MLWTVRIRPERQTFREDEAQSRGWANSFPSWHMINLEYRCLFSVQLWTPHGNFNRYNFLLASEILLFEEIAASLWNGDGGRISNLLLQNKITVESRQMMTPLSKTW